MDRVTNTYVPLFLLLSALTADVGGFTVSRGEVPVFNVSRGVLPTSTIPQPPKVTKPVVFVEYARFNCPPCEDMKAVKWGNAPFELKPGPAQIPAQHYPWVHWQDASGKWRYLESWSGKQDLIQRWELTQKPKPVVNPLAGNHPTVGVKGMTMEYHLRVDHGIDTRGLTAAELQKAHDACHSGRVTVKQINDYIAAERRRQGR